MLFCMLLHYGAYNAAATRDTRACVLSAGASPALEGTTGNFTTPPSEFDNNTATNIGGNAANTGSNAANGGGNAANTGGNAANAGSNAANNAANAGENSANVGENAANTGENAAPQINAALVIVARPSPVPSPVASPAANVAAIPDSSTNVIGPVNSADDAGDAAGLTGTVNAIPEGTGVCYQLADLCCCLCNCKCIRVVLLLLYTARTFNPRLACAL
jgi:hypothetical protein